MQNWKIFIGQLWNDLTSNCRLIISCDLTCLKIHLPIPILRKIQPLKYICLIGERFGQFFFSVMELSIYIFAGKIIFLNLKIMLKYKILALSFCVIRMN